MFLLNETGKVRSHVQWWRFITVLSIPGLCSLGHPQAQCLQITLLKYLDSWIFRKCCFLVLFFFLRHFLKREPYTKRDWLRREGKIVVSSTRLYISRSLDSSVSSVLNTEILFLGEIQFSDMCHQGNINCMFSWCISYCKTRDEQLDFLYPNKDGVIRCLILYNLEQFFGFFRTLKKCELILLLLRFC